MSEEIRNDRVFLVFVFGALVFWGLAIAGAFRAYSPVPFWDMWDGYLGFFVKIGTGDWSAWWAQHNEHRIVLARLLFSIDLAWFDGAGWFLLVVNYLLLGLVCLVFWVALKEDCPRPYRFVGLFLVIWLSSWSQENNLTWGFQSQFILAQLLPLSAFFLLHKAVDQGEHGHNSFVAACFFGVLSLGSMANGVLALPLMTAYAAITRLGWRRVAILSVLSGLGLLAYFHNYQTPAGYGSLLITTLKENPFGLVNYVLLYIGGPFFHVIDGGAGALMVAQAAGAFLVVCSAYLSWQSLRNIGQSSLQLALLVFILYVGGTALGTAGGRLFFGVDQALSSRYMTPALMAWAALFVLLAPKVVRLVDPHRWKLWAPMLLSGFALLPLQLKALQPQTAVLFERSVAALALELGVNDQAQIGQVFPSATWALSLAKIPSAKNISIFGNPLVKDVREKIGERWPELTSPGRVCQGHVDGMERVEEDSQYVRINGWLFDPKKKVVPRSLWIVDGDGAIVGYALLGQPRPDVVAAVNSVAVNAGFKGYFLTNAQGFPAKLFDPESKCTLPIPLQ